MNDPFARPALSVGVFYRDPAAALDWLARAFGFQRVMVITDPQGAVVHAEMNAGGGVIHVGAEWAEHVASPASTGGRNTQSVHLHLRDGLDAHCDRARGAGAVIVREPADQFYGDRVYAARDPEGHVWNFAMAVKAVSREEAERASGLTIEGWPLPSFEAFRQGRLAQGYDEVIERVWQPGQVVADHSHPFDADALVTQGEMWLRCGTRTRHLKTGDTFQLARDTPHDERYGPAGATYWVARRA